MGGALRSRSVGLGLLAAGLVALGCSSASTGGGRTEIGSELKSEDGWGVSALAVAARGDEAAVVYVEWSADSDASRVRLQRLDASGTFFGAGLELANGTRYGLESVAIASNGKTYLVCWAGAGEINCSALGETVEATPVFRAEGKGVSVTHGGSSWLIGTVTDPLAEPAKYVLQRLGDDFEAQSTAASWTVASEISGAFPAPLLASSDSEFLLVANDPARENRAQLYRFDHQLNGLAAPVDLGHRFWVTGSVAANTKLVAVSLSEAYGSNLMLIDAGGLVQSVEITGGFKLGMTESLIADGSKLIASWFTTEPRLHTQEFFDGHEAPVLPPGTTPDVAPGASTSASSKLVLVRVADRVLAVYPTQLGGPLLDEAWGAEGLAVRPLVGSGARL